MGQVHISVKILVLFLYNLFLPLAAQITSEMLPDDKPSRVVYYAFLAMATSPVIGYIFSRSFREMLNEGLKVDERFSTSMFFQAFGAYLCLWVVCLMGCTTAFYPHIDFDLSMYIVFLSGSGVAISPTIAQFIRK